MDCEFCRSPVHVWFNCPKKPDGWKPERLRKKLETAGVKLDSPIRALDNGSTPLPEPKGRRSTGIRTRPTAAVSNARFDKVAYQRDYMRERRAKLKEAK